MTEITRVPLQPIAKGSVAKVWLGVIVAVASGVALAGAGKPPMVDVETVTPGTGARPTVDDLIIINYQGFLPNHQVFDQNQHALVQIQGVVPGFGKALAQMQKGGKYVVKIPAALGYGAKGAGPIPPNTDITFNVELVDFRSRAEVEAEQRMMQQIMRARGGAQGQDVPQGTAPGAGPDASAGAPQGAQGQ